MDLERTVQEIHDMESLIDKMLKISADSAVYKKIAAYIEQYHMQIIFMTAGELASKLAVSQGSVSKFCMALGYRGYADFLRNLQKFVGKGITAPERFSYTSASADHTNDVIEKEVENIRSLKEITKGEDYEKLVTALVEADEVILLSARMSATLLPYMKYVLDKLRDKVHVITPESMEWNYLQVNYRTDRTAVIAIGLPRYPRILIEKLKELKKEGYQIYAVTDSRFSPLCEYACAKIYISTTVSSIFDIYSTPMAFINLMLTDVSKKIPDMQERLAKIENYDNYHKTYCL